MPTSKPPEFNIAEDEYPSNADPEYELGPELCASVGRIVIHHATSDSDYVHDIVADVLHQSKYLSAKAAVSALEPMLPSLTGLNTRNLVPYAEESSSPIDGDDDDDDGGDDGKVHHRGDVLSAPHATQFCHATRNCADLASKKDDQCTPSQPYSAAMANPKRLEVCQTASTSEATGHNKRTADIKVALQGGGSKSTRKQTLAQQKDLKFINETCAGLSRGLLGYPLVTNLAPTSSSNDDADEVDEEVESDICLPTSQTDTKVNKDFSGGVRSEQNKQSKAKEISAETDGAHTKDSLAKAKGKITPGLAYRSRKVAAGDEEEGAPGAKRRRVAGDGI